MPAQLTLTQLLIIGTIVGFLFGLVPLILGFFKKNLKLGLIGFAATLVAGVPLSFIGALPVSTIFAFIILLRRSSRATVGETNENLTDLSVEESENA